MEVIAPTSKPSGMNWQYVAPHLFPPPEAADWNVLENLNYQRLARVLEFQTCVAFLGSGCSQAVGFPSWLDLIPSTQPGETSASVFLSSLKEAATRKLVSEPAALQLFAERNRGRHGLVTAIRAKLAESLSNYETSRQTDNHAHVNDPYAEIQSFGIRRFITTNYDPLTEAAVERRRGSVDWVETEKCFDQSDLRKLAAFSLPLANASRYMVFHCHGWFSRTLLKDPSTDHRDATTLVITEDDYKRWYLSDEHKDYQDMLALVLESNPLFFVGYSHSDVDLSRILRRLALRHTQGLSHGNVFCLLDRSPEAKQLDPGNSNVDLLAQQARLGISLFSYDLNTTTLAQQLNEILKASIESQSAWRSQPAARTLTVEPIYRIKKDPSADDPLFRYSEDVAIQDLGKRLREQRLLVMLGPPGSGKYIKLCQLAESADALNYRPLLFSAHGEEDVYSRLWRIVEVAELSLGIQPLSRKDISAALNAVMNAPPSQGEKPLLLMISGLEQLFRGVTAHEGGERPSFRNDVQRQMYDFLKGLLQSCNSQHRVVVACSAVPPGLLDTRDEDATWLIGAPPLPDRFHHSQFDLDKDEYRRLRWRLQGDTSAILAASAFVRAGGNDRAARLEKVLRTAERSPDNRGSRVAHVVMRELAGNSEGYPFETMLACLSSFSRPFRRLVFDEAYNFCKRHDLQKVTRDREDIFGAVVAHRLVEQVEVQALGSRPPDEALVVPPIMRRYFYSTVLGHEQAEGTLFGLNGYLSSGPFPRPGGVGLSIGTARRSKPGASVIHDFLEHLLSQAENRVFEIMRQRPNGITASPEDAEAQRTVQLIRAAFNVLRTNFACQTVPLWGTFADYIRLCARCYDLVMNYARCYGLVWQPGYEEVKQSALAPLTRESVVWLLNELGLAFFCQGSLQDAISLWGRAFDWQAALNSSNPQQARAYSASLHCHLGAAHIQIGRLDAAADYFSAAREDALASHNEELLIILRGYQALVRQLRGGVQEAREEYDQIVKELRRLGQHRAESYFMRYQAMLHVTANDLVEARRVADESMSIAASVRLLDSVAYSRQILAETLAKGGHWREAIREYRVALKEARDIGSKRLEAAVMSGLARVQLALGEAEGARQRALEALRISNECVAVFQQARALILLGSAYVGLGNLELGKSVLELAYYLSADAEYLSLRREAEAALIDIDLGRTFQDPGALHTTRTTPR